MLLPEEFAKDFKAPEKRIPRRRSATTRSGARRSRTAGTTTCNFEYAGRLAEAVLLGNVAYRVGQGDHLGRAKGTTGDKAADAFLGREYRKGWELPEA